MTITTFDHDLPAEIVRPWGPDDVLVQLVAAGAIRGPAALHAQAIAAREQLDLRDVLMTRFGVSPRSLAMAEGAALTAPVIDPLCEAPDPGLVRQFGAARCLADLVLPWRQVGEDTLVLCDRFDRFRDLQPALEQVFGQVRMALATPDQITGVLSRDFPADLVRWAEQRLPAAASSRGWRAGRALILTASAALTMLALALWAPLTLLSGLTACAVLLLVLNGAIKCAAALSGLRLPPQPIAASDDPLPVISLLIPLYHERAIADHLLTRLEALDYPRERLDVCLVLEDNDETTRAALGRTALLTWMRSIIVPEGTLRTKPRALNYALDFARGSIIGVYDAEDAPDPDQLRVVAAAFAAAGPQVACLQGVLDYYNTASNWLTRCFTIEYASWFRVVLPGYARLGLVVPLGGTTLFLRRDVLQRLGGWDAHNVTEDADLGLRLARAGYTTAFIPTVTREEANGQYWTWIKQRSRWLKGYAITYCVHMRAPRRLWRDLGPWRFFGVQMLFVGTLAQFVLAPLVWSFWLIPLGLPHPAAALLPPLAFRAMVMLFILGEVAHLAIAALGVHRAGKAWLIPWALTLQFYFPLGSAAVYKGLLELTWKPFFWDKTAHGILLPQTAVIPPPPPLPHPASTGS